MRKTWMAALAAVALTITGCHKLTQYPDNIVGYWASKNTATGYTASLEVTTDSAIVQVASPTMFVVKDLHGTLSYDKSSGRGTFTTATADAPMVAIQALNKTSLKVTVTAVDGKNVLYEGIFMREDKPVTPDPNPQPTPEKDATYIAVHTFGFVDYYDDNGDYNLVLIGKDSTGIEYYATFCVVPKQASFVGHFALLQGTMRKEYCNFLPHYTYGSGSKDFLFPDTMCITVSMQGEHYNIEGRITYMGTVYVMQASDIAGQDQRWGYEPTEKKTFNEVYTEFIGFDDIDQFHEVQITLDNQKTFMQITFFTNTALPAGTYPVDFSFKEGTVAASKGYNVTYQNDETSYMGVYEESGTGWKDTYYFDSGMVKVSYPTDSTISIIGDVKTHYGSNIHFSYGGKYDFQGYSEESTEE